MALWKRLTLRTFRLDSLSLALLLTLLLSACAGGDEPGLSTEPDAAADPPEPIAVATLPDADEPSGDEPAEQASEAGDDAVDAAAPAVESGSEDPPSSFSSSFGGSGAGCPDFLAGVEPNEQEAFARIRVELLLEMGTINYPDSGFSKYPALLEQFMFLLDEEGLVCGLVDPNEWPVREQSIEAAGPQSCQETLASIDPAEQATYLRDQVSSYIWILELEDVSEARSQLELWLGEGPGFCGLVDDPGGWRAL